eukprot:gene4528-6393_t
MSRFLFILIACTLGTHVSPFADWMTNSFCDRPLKLDEVIMNNDVEASNERLILVSRNEQLLKSGDEYQPGEKLTVKLSNEHNQFVFETDLGKFIGGGCNGKRTSNKDSAVADIIMPLNNEDFGEVVSIWAGWATGHTTVHVTPVFKLNPKGYQGENNEVPKDGKQIHHDEESHDIDLADEIQPRHGRRRSHHDLHPHDHEGLVEIDHHHQGQGDENHEIMQKKSKFDSIRKHLFADNVMKLATNLSAKGMNRPDIHHPDFNVSEFISIKKREAQNAHVKSTDNLNKFATIEELDKIERLSRIKVHHKITDPNMFKPGLRNVDLNYGDM